MSEPIFDDFVKTLVQTGNFDHIDLEQVDKLAAARGLNKKKSRTAFFAAQDISALREAELLEGGDGSETSKVKPKKMLAVSLRPLKSFNKQK